ncbi:MAG: glucose/arabinose dehydrogenase/mono/diheme cytochrome c family protein [Verrucomicrobiales bacterium]|jgi:glucose/arabinose dehydrogenase/mono/diheme cytochrome c family protein
MKRTAGFILGGLLSQTMTMAQLPSRVANTSLQMPPQVYSSVAYDAESIQSGSIGAPVALASPPGATNALYVVDREGSIIVIPDLVNPVPATFIDLGDRVEMGFGEEGLLGLAFHPHYASNGYFYVCYTEQPGGESFVHYDTLSRFTRSSTNALRGDASSEIRLIRQPGDMWARNHNGGDLQFGPDGYLYVSLGDGGNDNRAQRLDGGFYAGIIRIDVDMRPGNPLPNAHPASLGPYAIPHDNPFIGTANFNGTVVNPASIRTEYYAVGLRNPWRMTVDPQTGEIITGDVGEGDYEEVDYIIPGGNYGWPYFEGPDLNSGTPPPGVLFLPPIHAYGRDEGLSVIGGIIYRGERLPELQGFYVFTDWANGEIRALLPDGTNEVSTTLLVDTNVGFGPSAFGRDPRNGDILMCDNRSWTTSLRRVIRNTTASTSDLPATLADTGAFSDLATLTPEAGIVPYEINVPFWSDDAIKRRWYSLPDTNTVFGFDTEQPWGVPTGAVWIKHFDIDMEAGNPASRRRLETRFLVKATNNIYGVTYRWDSTTNASLVAEEGFSEDLIRMISGSVVTQRWVYPSRGACLSCHQPNAGYALGFNTVQLNCEAAFGGVITNQVLAMSHQGYITNELHTAVDLRALAPADDDAASLTWRVRSYLQANCAQCHNGSGLVRWDARISTPLEDTQILNGLLNDLGGDPGKRVIVPGDPSLSMLLERIHIRGARQMPPIASVLVDTQAVALVTAWINSLAGWRDYDTWSLEELGAVFPRDGDLDLDRFSNYGEYLLGLAADDPNASWGLDRMVYANGLAELVFEAPAHVAVQVEWKSSPMAPEPWRPLDVLENRLYFPANSSERRVVDPSVDTGRIFRARLITP